MKISNLEFEVFCPKIRQIEVRSAPLSYNVNKLSRVFSLFVTFSDFLLNSCLKLVGTPVFQGRNYSRKMARAGSDFAFSSSGFAFSSSGQLGPRLDSRTSSSNTPKSSKKRLGRARARARAQARSAPTIYS